MTSFGAAGDTAGEWGVEMEAIAADDVVTEPRAAADPSSAPAPAVSIHGVSKKYGRVTGVEDLTLSVGPGEILCLLGPSGAGKSTLLNLITGLIRPDTGRITFGTRDVTDVPPERRGVGAVFQSFALFPHMSVYDNVAFGLRCKKTPKAVIAQRVPEHLEAVGLADKAKRRPHELSGGERQRVAFARALITNPAVLALDEPFGSLDVQLRGSLRQMVRQMVRQFDVPAILITHDRDDAFGVADRVGIIRSGQLLQIGTLSEVYQQPRNAFIGRFLGDANVVVVADGRLRQAAPGEASLLIRPEHVRVVPAGTGRFDGRYLGARQAGHLTRMAVDVDGTPIDANVIGDVDDRHFVIGDAVAITWEDRHVHQLEADRPGAAQAPVAAE
jgi:ABC-type Fe3+/spermidine/putrescine transport system ATPase subunit